MRQLWDKLATIYSNLIHGIQNIFIYFPIIWIQRDWDWDYLSRLMEFKLRRMSRLFSEHGHLANSDRCARQTLICAHLLQRLREDEYMLNNMPLRSSYEELPGWQWHKHVESLVRQDQELLLKTFKHFRSWWD